MASLKSIAEKCNVSITTVSRVLNNDKTLSVTSTIKNSILEEAQNQAYLPPRLRRAQEESLYTIALGIKPIFRPDYTPSLFPLLNNIGTEFNMQFKALETLIKADGILLIGNYTDEEIESYKGISCNVLVINNNTKNYQYDRIIMDYDDAENQVLEYFLSLGLTDIGYFGGTYKSGDTIIGKKRMEYFKLLLKAKELYKDENFCLGTMEANSGYQLTLKAEHIPQALLFSDSSFAFGAIKALKERGENPVTVIYQDLDGDVEVNASAHLIIYPESVWQNACRFLTERIRKERETAFAVYVPAKLEIY